MATFAKRHHEAIAAMFRKYHRDFANPAINLKDVQPIDENTFADMFEKDNPAFNREWFLKACLPRN